MLILTINPQDPTGPLLLTWVDVAGTRNAAEETFILAEVP